MVFSGWVFNKIKVLKKKTTNNFIFFNYGFKNKYNLSFYKGYKFNIKKSFRNLKQLNFEQNAKNIIHSLYFYTKKVKFKSKCFRVKYYRRKKILKFLFGKSHREWLFLKNISFKKKGKYKYILKHYHKQKLYNFCRNFANVRRWSWYTGRYLRISRQVVKRKRGKKKTYN